VARWGSARAWIGSGGSAWESNPAPPREQGATDFEDREGHRAPFASPGLPAPRASRGPVRAGPETLAFDQTHIARAGAFLRLLRGELHTLAFSQKLEHGPPNGAAVEEMLNPSLIPDEPETLVNEKTRDRAGRHTLPSDERTPENIPRAQPAAVIGERAAVGRHGLLKLLTTR